MRAELVAAARRMNELGLNRGTSGNVSVRHGDGFLITPSGIPYDEMGPGDVVPMSMDGVATGPLVPSSEWRMHRDLLAARADAGAVLHAHPPFATALACLHLAVPSFHYMVAVAGGTDIRCAPYATYGTQELSDHTVAAMRDRKACLLANHGLAVIGAGLDEALSVAAEVETLCEMYWRALQVGEPELLDSAQMAEVLERFAAYGQPAD